MSKIDTGFFTMEDATTVNGLDLSAGKEFLIAKINKFVEDHPATKPENIRKVTQTVQTARTRSQLVLAVGNLVMAHPSEGQKVIR